MGPFLNIPKLVSYLLILIFITVIELFSDYDTYEKVQILST